MLEQKYLRKIDKCMMDFEREDFCLEEDILERRINDFYKKIKAYQQEYYYASKGKPRKFYYDAVGDRVCSLSDSLYPDKFLIDSFPNLTYDLVFSNEHSEIIKRIIKYSRLRLISDLSISLNEFTVKSSLVDCCSKASDIVDEVSLLMGAKSKSVIIYPGFKKDSDIPSELNFHYFNIVVINGKKYIVDCSYRQFFLLASNCLDRLGIMHFTGISAGKAMLMDEKRKEVAMKILSDGYIEATEENIKAYLDGFAISFRNALFYEETNDFSYTTPYTALDYIHFLEGSDSQLDHESKKTLGLQLKPLKNSNMSFEKR